MRFARSPLFAMSLIALLSVRSTAQAVLGASGGVTASVGRYGGTQSVTTVAATLGVTAGSPTWRFSAYFPVVMQNATEVRLIGGGMAPVGGMGSSSAGMNGTSGMGSGMMGTGSSTTGNFAESASNLHVGVGDPRLRFDRTVWHDASFTQTLAFSGSVKVPVSRGTNGFGTGHWDAGLGAIAVAPAAGNTLLADVTYWRIGRATGEPYRNATSAALTLARGGGARPIAGAFGAILASTPLASGLVAPVQVGCGWNWQRAAGAPLSIAAYVGLTNSAPRIAVGLNTLWPGRP